MSQSRYQFLVEKYVVTKIISEVNLHHIIEADPTSIFKEIDNKKVLEKVGKYTQWILHQYDKMWVHCEDGTLLFNRDPTYFFEDLYKIHDDLKVFDIVKHRKGVIPQEKKDVNKIQDASELYYLVKPFISLKDIDFTKAEIKQKVIREDVELLYDGIDWDIITPKTPEAATALSGPPLTRWCTATEGRNAFETYNKQGKLYIIRDKRITLGKGRAEGHHKPVYQFHFETHTFMNVDDSRVELVDILIENEELKRFFKHILIKYFLKTKLVHIKYPNDNPSKFIAIYGFEDFLNSLPEDITDLDIDCQASKTPISFNLPSSIKRFKKLETMFLRACISDLPEELGELKSLQNISFPENKKLKNLPESLIELPELMTINLRGSTNCIVPNTLKRLDEANKIYIIQ